VSDLAYGTLVVPFRRLASASMQPPAPMSVLWVLPIAWLVWPRGRVLTRIETAVAIAWCAILVLSSGGSYRYYRAGWYAGWGLPFLIASAVAIDALMPRAVRGAGALHEMARTISIVAVCCILIEFPFAAPIYTLYALPLSLLALACLVRARGQTPVAAQVIAAVFFCTFAYTRIMPSTLYSMGEVFRPIRETAQLTLPRARLRVEPDDAAQYDSLIRFVQGQAQGRVLWAGPDAPEVYFLTGIPNRTRTTFEFLDRSPAAELPLSARLARIGASIVVLKREPEFSVAPSFAQLNTLSLSYPNHREFPGFVVFWR
jgi:hypothetical protein